MTVMIQEKNSEVIIPEWMKDNAVNQSGKKSSHFADKSRIGILKVLSKLHFSSGNGGRYSASAVIKLSATLLIIILIACSRNMLLVYILATGILIRLCLVKGEYIRAILGGSVVSTIFTAIILLPAVFMGNPRTMLTVSIKVFCSVTMVNLMAKTTVWNELTSAMKVFFVPDIFVFILDITLKYIDLAGRYLCDMLQALSLRTIGKADKHNSGLGGVMGTSFLHTYQLSKEMYESMQCRGFNGTYNIKRKNYLKKTDGIYILGIAAIIILFLYLER